LEGPLQSVCFLCRCEIQDGHHRRTYINIEPYGKMFKCIGSNVNLCIVVVAILDFWSA
jgi:hypothetical protein